MSPQSNKTKNEVRSLIGLSWLEVLLGGLALIALSARAALSVFFTAFGVNKEMHDVIASLRDAAGSFTSLPTVRSGMNLLLWILIGLILVSLVWALIVVIVDTRNDIVISQAFLHPHSFHKSQYWIAAVARRLIAAVLISSMAIYIFLLLRGTPIIYGSILSLFSYRTSVLTITVPSALLAIVMWLAGWHLIAIVRRLGMRLDKEIAKLS